MKIINKVAVVTGAGSGIGKALAIQLAEKGALLAISDIHAENLEETYQAILPKTGAGGIMKSVFDVADKEKMHEFAEQVAAQFGKTDIVINNAGVALGKTSLLDLKYEDFEWLMGINFWGMVYGTKAFLPQLIKRPEASIVNISSLFGLIGVAYQVAYCTSKFAIRGFNESLRMELQHAHPHVVVTSVHPGGIQTNIARNSRWTTDIDPAKRERDIQRFEKLFITPAEEAARQIIRGIERKNPRVVIGRDAKIPDFLARFFPRKYTSIVGRVLQRFERE